MQNSYLKRLLVVLLFLTLAKGLFAQTEFPAGNFWSFDMGFAMTDTLVRGTSYQLVIDPKIWLSVPLMVGNRIGISYSIENDSRDILSFETQVYLRWNFLRLGRDVEKTTNIFVQGGIGLLAAYRGNENPFDDVTMTRGSLLADVALGATIPLSPRWHIEPSARAGYPHIAGISLTAGYKFPLPQSTRRLTTDNYLEIIRNLPPSEIIRLIRISAIEFILFGPDIGRYNVGIDRDAQQLNELVLNYIAQVLKESPNFRVRIEGHANPHTINVSEADDLMALSTLRASVVAEQLRARGVNEEQIVIIAFGGTRTATNEWDVRNRNRRVELIMIQLETN
jgi:hypothetical protein